MRDAAARLVGRHDFAAFTCSGSEPGSTVRTLHRLDVVRDGDVVAVEAEGEGFLYKMVRSIVGTLLEVGRGERSPAEVTDVLEGHDRTRAGPSAPARGLTLVTVTYERLESGDPSASSRSHKPSAGAYWKSSGNSSPWIFTGSVPFPFRGSAGPVHRRWRSRPAPR